MVVEAILARVIPGCWITKSSKTERFKWAPDVLRGETHRISSLLHQGRTTEPYETPTRGSLEMLSMITFSWSLEYFVGSRFIPQIFQFRREFVFLFRSLFTDLEINDWNHWQESTITTDPNLSISRSFLLVSCFYSTPSPGIISSTSTSYHGRPRRTRRHTDCHHRVRTWSFKLNILLDRTYCSPERMGQRWSSHHWWRLPGKF